MSAIPEMTPSKMFLAARSVPPGNVWTFTFPLVRFSTSFAQRSIWTQGKVAAGGKFAYRSVIGSAAGDVTGTAKQGKEKDRQENRQYRFRFHERLPGKWIGKPSASSGGKIAP